LWARYKNCNAAWLGNTKGTKKIQHKEHRESIVFLLWARYRNCNAAWLGNTKSTKKIQHKEHREIIFSCCGLDIKIVMLLGLETQRAQRKYSTKHTGKGDNRCLGA
jgi:glutathionylspermidine synthase